MEKYKFTALRLLGYVAGFLLFYEPFSYFHRLTSGFLIEKGFTSIHVPCARIPLTSIFQGRFFDNGPTSLFFVALLLVVSFIFGPLFCGRLCPAGAVGEFLSKLLPDRVKLDWTKFVPVVPVRYGFFVGFLFSTFMGFSTPCTYCNYFALELVVDGLAKGHLVHLSTSLLSTFVLAFIILGLFTKGGRGYCNYICPVGAFSSLCHYLGSKVPHTFGMKVQQEACVGCGLCAKACPMRAVQLKERKAQVETLHCICCGVCAETCPKGAIRYEQK